MTRLAPLLLAVACTLPTAPQPKPSLFVPASCGDRPVGTFPGDCSVDWTLTGTDGVTRTLYDDLAGQPVLLQTSVMGCGICEEVSQRVGELQETHEHLDLRAITLLTEDPFGDQPSNRDALAWSDDLGLRHATLVDYHHVNDAVGSILHPAAVLISADLHILWRGAGEEVAHDLEHEVHAALP